MIDKRWLVVILILSLMGNVMLPKHLVFDLSDTLFKISQYKAVRELGLWDSLQFFIHNMHHSKTLIRASMYDILNENHKPITDFFDVNSDVARDVKGRPLPLLMQQWFKGKKTSEQLALEVPALIEQYHHFTGASHKKMVQDTLAWLFDPERYAAAMDPIDGAVELLEKCLSVKDADGKPRNDFWILSNFDTETFKYLYADQRNQVIFNYFPRNHIFISGFMGSMKPNPLIFTEFFKTTKLNPADCIFIDNQPENIISARASGMQAIWLQDGDYEAVEKQLKQLGVL